MGENKIVCKVTAEDGETVKNYTITVTKTEGSQPSGQPGAAAADGVKVQTIAKTVTIVPLDKDVKVPDGLVENSLTINGEKVQGWIAAGEGQQEYCVVYAVNADGEKNFYRYDLKERTMQRYFEAAAGAQKDVVSQIEDYNQLVHDYDMRFIIIMVLIGVCVVLFIIILVLLFKKGGHNGPYDDDDEDMKDDGDDELFGRKASKEERYLRGLEAEEEEALARDEERLELSLIHI